MLPLQRLTLRSRKNFSGLFNGHFIEGVMFCALHGCTQSERNFFLLPSVLNYSVDMFLEEYCKICHKFVENP